MENLLTLEDVSKQLKVSKMTIYRYIKAWKIKAYKLWKELRISDSEYNSFLEKMRFTPSNSDHG